MSTSWSLGDRPPFARPVLYGNSMATCTQERHLWIWIYPWISTEKSVDMDMDKDGKFHIHGKPGTRPALTPASKLVLDLPTPEGWKAELT